MKLNDVLSEESHDPGKFTSLQAALDAMKKIGSQIHDQEEVMQLLDASGWFAREFKGKPHTGHTGVKTEEDAYNVLRTLAEKYNVKF